MCEYLPPAVTHAFHDNCGRARMCKVSTYSVPLFIYFLSWVLRPDGETAAAAAPADTQAPGWDGGEPPRTAGTGAGTRAALPNGHTSRGPNGKPGSAAGDGRLPVSADDGDGTGAAAGTVGSMGGGGGGGGERDGTGVVRHESAVALLAGVVEMLREQVSRCWMEPVIRHRVRRVGNFSSYRYRALFSGKPWFYFVSFAGIWCSLRAWL